MTDRIAVFAPGLIRLKAEIRHLSGAEPHFALFSARGCSRVAGWGHKPTASRARAAAKRGGIPYWAFEDGFIRSLRPGRSQPPMSMVMDRSGIYYDARLPSDLETLLETCHFAPAELGQARAILSLIASHRLSKYNHGADSLGDFAVPRGMPVVVVADQTVGDESIAGSLSDALSFARMAEAAVRENPGAFIIAKLHPETLAGTKAGYLEGIARRLGMNILARHVTPWCLFDLGPRVYTVSSQFGFEAVMAGLNVTCFGVPFYAGWGLTDDRASIPRRAAKRTVEELAAAVYLRYSRFFDPWTRAPVDAMTAIDQLAFLRRGFLGNSRPVTGYRIARWKRRAVSAMLDGPHGPPRFANNLAAAISDAGKNGGAIAAWGIDAIRMRPKLAEKSISCLAVEDGFLRSVGLGAAFAQPLSLVFDATGLYYDPTRPSDIESMLADAEVTAEETLRARALRQRIVAGRITKYNVASADAALPVVPGDRAVVLVPGQVADDWAVLLGRPPEFPPSANVNAVLLERARQRHPQAFVIFKPHPDVEHLGRAGALAEDRQNPHADLIACSTPLESLLVIASHVETYSSLAGFEALLRGVSVTTHGLPFYAGWGLTDDRAVSPRRGRNRSLDELTAVAIIRYPRYWDPVSGLACPPEVALFRIAEARARRRSLWRRLGLAAGRSVILAKRFARLVKRPENDT